MTKALRVCGDCLRARYAMAESYVVRGHARSRQMFALPEEPPRAQEGTACRICTHGCRIPLDGVGYCGLPVGDRTQAAASWYHNPLPTNCVADFVCPGGTGTGYPRYAHRPGPQYGYKNLAVFYEACSFDCLYCQNWHYRVQSDPTAAVPPTTVVEAVNARTACICFFGGDPTPQLPHSLAVAELALAASAGRILRICWETNGTMARELVDRMVEIALVSGGVIKFDLKAWDDGVHRALTGASNRWTVANFAHAAARVRERPEVPLLVASTLLVPGYVDHEEVAGIAGFIADLDLGIPYSLLAFHPSCLLDDLPITSWAHMERCVEAAKGAGLTTVHIGNRHLLQPRDYGGPAVAMV